MKIGILITARLKSSRLKKKVLKDLNGYTVIERIINRAKKVVSSENIILCTSTFKQDLPLVETAIKEGIYYFNGDPDDVIDRLYRAANFFGIDYFISITADNPLFSVYQCKKMISEINKNNEIDYIYSTKNPLGINVHAIKTKALEVVCSIKEEIDTEIWGRLINRPEIFKVRELKIKKNLINLPRITLDEIDDYKFLKILFEKFDKDYLIQEKDIINTLNEDKNLKKINSHVKQLDLDKKTINRIDNFFKKNKKKLKIIKNKIYT